MPSQINSTNITPPRVPLIDQRTGLISREWYRFFLNLFVLTGSGSNFTSLTDLQLGPPPLQLESVNLDPSGPTVNPSDAPLTSQIAEIQKQINDLQESPGADISSLTAQLQALVDAFGAAPQPALGTMAQLQQAWLPWVTFDTAPEFTPPNVGTVAWDGGTTLGVQMTANVLGRVNESGYYYIKASAAITKGDVVMFTGAVGASGVPTGAPATGVTDGSYIMGIAAESLALNAFGLVQFQGTLRGVNTAAYADGDILWYNPAVAGGLTKTKPSAPNVKVQMAAVISATANGTILIRVSAGSELGGTDSNVQFGTLANNDLIQYDSTAQYWKNVAPSSVVIGTATNLAGGAAGSVPYQTAPNTTTFLGIGTAAQVLKTNAGATAPEWVSGAALTKTDDTNVTLTLGGTPASSLLAATSLTLGWNGQLAVSRGGTGVATTTANYVFAGPTSGGAAAPSFRALVSGDIPALSYVSSVGATAPITSTGGLTPTIGVTAAALTKTDDTNVTLTLGGSPTTALLAATSLTLGWTGQLGLTRGGTNASLTASAGSVAYSTASALALNTAGNSGDWLKSAGTGAPAWTAPAALTKTDDTNVTLTLGGSASTALLNAASLTLGWTGTLAVSRGGTGTGTAFTAGSVVFAGASGTYSQNNAKFFWDDTNSRLGIGTATPAGVLESIGTNGVFITRSTKTASTNVGARFMGGAYTGNLATAILLDGISGENQLTLGGGTAVGEPATSIRFNTGTAGTAGAGTQRAIIDSSGNVGIGTSSPSSILHAKSTTGVIATLDGSGTTTGAVNTGAALMFNGYDGAAARNFAQISGYKENSTSGNYATYLAFSTRPNGGSVTERGRFDSSGNFGIGATAPTARLDIRRADSGVSGPVIEIGDSTGGSGGRYGGIGYSAASPYPVQFWGGSLSFLTGSSTYASATERVQITSTGNIYGTSGTTGMTDGFFYIPAAAGAPTGTPTAIAGRVPMYYDTTNNKFYIYNGAWKSVALA